MNTEIQRFDFKGAALRTLTDENGEPWFVAKDVCDVLELSNVSQTLARRIDDDEKSSITLNDGTPGNPNRAIVSESGLYALAPRIPQAGGPRFQTLGDSRGAAADSQDWRLHPNHGRG